ncbi:hypothetical protein PTSG_00280 [Salpingoeca rosetta]|uniref:Uncharacterized protein n=1 Tax=Salpingoeca rosetta (strain ATCC 50818 / BSB-021) TaxID=946362 RepID=F2TW14_SALR5|nr:uncharacterized protein PTSG_00280 [Salpingoeca rosetta]EGD72260.1 hypothetical protein PTSG_00280 [Salpingoeca rosetta]|eukprot:XP_004998831.1 hypothetical protein PTSG_00280 [Salpingoeca rosetta]
MTVDITVPVSMLAENPQYGLNHDDGTQDDDDGDVDVDEPVEVEEDRAQDDDNGDVGADESVEVQEEFDVTELSQQLKEEQAHMQSALSQQLKTQQEHMQKQVQQQLKGMKQWLREQANMQSALSQQLMELKNSMQLGVDRRVLPAEKDSPVNTYTTEAFLRPRRGHRGREELRRQDHLHQGSRHEYATPTARC